MKNIKKITILFENCEVIDVPAEAIVDLYFKDICYDLVMYHNYPGEVYKRNKCKEAILTLNIEKLIVNDNSETSLRQRLKKYKDIVSYNINYESGKNFEVLVPWDNSGICDNKYQSVNVIDNYLEIKILKSHNAIN